MCAVQVGVARTCDDRALVDLVDQMVYEPAYNRLRTQLQLGYTVRRHLRTSVCVVDHACKPALA